MAATDIEEDFECAKCGRRNRGFARCQTPSCGVLRKEFSGREAVVVGRAGRCVLSGALTDVRLPNGDYLWAPYFLGYVKAGWLDESFGYAKAYYDTHAHKHS